QLPEAAAGREKAEERELEATLAAEGLGTCLAGLRALGVRELRDVLHLTVQDLEEAGLTRVQSRQLQRAAGAAPDSAAAPAGAQGPPRPSAPPAQAQPAPSTAADLLRPRDQLLKADQPEQPSTPSPQRRGSSPSGAGPCPPQPAQAAAAPGA
ncbi:unnamed protein product, partial [Prorocentrum cordatum]